MRSTAAVILFVLISGAHFKEVAGAWSKRDTATFFKGPFSPCKGSRPRRTVELAKTHVFATRLFNEIGIKTIIRLSTKYRYPQGFLYKINDLVCLLTLFGYTALSDDGSMILPPEVKAVDAIAFVKRFFNAVKIGLPEIVFHQRGRTFSLPWSAVDEIMEVLVPAFLKVGEGDIPRDVNMILHFVEFSRKVLL